MKRGHVPIRTCVGCLKKRPKQELLRLVLGNDNIGIGECEGRGLYLCPDQSCLERALKSKNMKRFLRRRLSDQELAEIKRRVSGQNILDGGCSQRVICSYHTGGGVVA